MSSRRTRRGTLLEGDLKSERIKQTCSPKGNQLSPKDSILSQKCKPKMEDDSAACNINQEFKNPQTHVVYSSPGKSPLTRRNLWDCLQKGVKKKDMSSSDTICNESIPKKGLSEMVNFGNATVVQDTQKQSRKPEILVSLLENEAYPCVKFKAKSNEKPRCGDENKSILNHGHKCSRQINKLRDGDTFSTSTAKHVCFFPYCEHHKETFKPEDFLPISEVPEEPFLVSLSKDKNKELNMVTTSSGTLRVGPGCSMRRFLPSGSCGKLPSGEFSCGDNADIELRTDIKENKKLSSLLPGLTRSTLPSTSKNQALQHFATQKECVVKDDVPNSIDANLRETDKSLSVQDLGNIVARTEENKDKDFGLTRSCSAQSPTVNYSTEFAQDRKSGNLNDFAPLKDQVSTKSHGASILPLLENSSSDTNVKTFTTSTANSSEATDVDEINKKKSMEPVSLLQSSTQLSKIPPPSNLEPSGSRLDSNSTIKRSERIRCKSKLPMEAKVKLEKFVPSPDKAPKSKLKCSEKPILKIKPSIKKKSVKKIATISSKKKKGLTVKITKPLKMKKSQMTRKVMDGIVQSIEETVLRASQDKDFEKSGEMLAEETAEDCTNLKADLSDGSSSFKAVSSSGFLVVKEKGSGVVAQQSKPVLSEKSQSTRNDPKKKMSKLHKSKQKASKNKFLSHSSTFKKKLTTASKLKQNKDEIQRKSKLIKSSESKSDAAMLEIKNTVSESKLDTINSLSAVTAKRSRKKSKKAKEAFSDFGLAVFWEDNEPAKKSKSKKRINTNDSDSCSGNTKRPRRNSQLIELMADPVLEQHAFILWASENRSEVEIQHPEASAYEVDAILSSRWSDVVDTLKGRFFLRAREALSGDDRLSLQAGSVVSNLEHEPLGRSEQHDDQDPQFIEFIGLPVDKQRDMLRKWLRFFQKVLPKKEYIEFILTFKHACGESDILTSEPGKPIKRPRMSCLDPTHYRMLFDLIRLTKPRIIEVCKDKKGKEKKIVSQTYSMIVHKLVCGEPWPEVNMSTCQSQSLTEVLVDLSIDCTVTTFDGFTSSLISSPFPDYTKSRKVSNTLIDTFIADSEKECKIPDTTSTLFGTDPCSWNGAQDLPDLSLGADFSCDQLLDESDYSCLNTDVAQNLLAGLFELNDLPVIDQSTLDEVFLAPPSKDTRCIQHRRGGGGQGGGSTGAAASFSPHSLSITESSIFPKMNIHYPSTIPNLSCHHHHQMLPPSSTSAILAGKQYFPRDMRNMTPVSLAPQSQCSFRKDSLMDMHSYSISMEESSDNAGIGHLTNLCMNRVGPPNMPSKCMKAYSKTLLGPSGKLSIQAMPNTAHKGSTCFSTIQSGGASYCSRQQEHLISSHILTGSSSMGMKSGKSKSHPFVSAKFNPQTYSMKASNTTNPASSCSRFYPQHAGLGSSSPLITSLSPLRNVKYQGQVSTKLYSSSPCTMMPYRPRLQLSESPNMGTSSLCHRRSTHTMPISTTLNSFATARSQGGNIQQIKVCLPTQALKIPIAKLRGGKKSTYIKGKLKNVGLPPPGSETIGNISCMAQQGCKTSGVLAKVLSLQVKNEAACAGADCRSAMNTDVSYASPKLSSTTSTFIGTMRPMTSQLDYCSVEKNGYRNSKKVQLVSVDSRNGCSRPLGSTHTAVIVSPVSVHKRNCGRPFLYPSASNAMGTFRTSDPLTSDTTVATTTFNSSPENMTSLHMNHAFHNSRYLPKNNQSEAKLKCSRLPSVSVAKERGPVIKSNPLSEQEDEDESGGSQFVVVGTRTTCLPIPQKRTESFSLMKNTTDRSLPDSLVTAGIAHQCSNEHTSQLQQSPGMCSLGGKQCETSFTTCISSYTTNFYDTWYPKPVSTITNRNGSMGHNVICSKDSYPTPTHTSVKEVQEKPCEDTTVDNSQKNKNVSKCQINSNLQDLSLKNRNYTDESLQETEETENQDQTTRSLQNLSACEKDMKYLRNLQPDTELMENEYTQTSSNCKEMCEGEPALPAST